VETPRQKKIRSVVGQRHPGVIVVLEDVHDPHNAAAIMRSCDALGIQDVWLVFKEEAAYNPRRIGKSSSSSANKWLSFKTFKSTEECCRELVARGYVSVATVLDNPTDVLDTFDGARYERVALWVGNEHRGLSAEARAHAAHRITLPMRGMVESLNVSVATALFLFSIVTARRSAGITELPPDEQEALYRDLSSR
jgi:tRNA (guanosine-2'-O-)-methyltransferase